MRRSRLHAKTRLRKSSSRRNESTHAIHPPLRRAVDRATADRCSFHEDEPAFDARLETLVKRGLTAVWANNIYGIALGKRLGLRVHGGFALNVTNTESLLAYEGQSLASVTVSFELAMAKIRDLGGSVLRGIVSYGSLPLMHLRNCPVRANSGCAACGGCGALTDRRQVAFPLECDAQRSATLLNSVPLDLGRQEPERPRFSAALFHARKRGADRTRNRTFPAGRKDRRTSYDRFVLPGTAVNPASDSQALSFLHSSTVIRTRIHRQTDATYNGVSFLFLR